MPIGLPPDSGEPPALASELHHAGPNLDRLRAAAASSGMAEVFSSILVMAITNLSLFRDSHSYEGARAAMLAKLPQMQGDDWAARGYTLLMETPIYLWQARECIRQLHLEYPRLCCDRLRLLDSSKRYFEDIFLFVMRLLAYDVDLLYSARPEQDEDRCWREVEEAMVSTRLSTRQRELLDMDAEEWEAEGKHDSDDEQGQALSSEQKPSPNKVRLYIKETGSLADCALGVTHAKAQQARSSDPPGIREAIKTEPCDDVDRRPRESATNCRDLTPGTETASQVTAKATGEDDVAEVASRPDERSGRPISDPSPESPDHKLPSKRPLAHKRRGMIEVFGGVGAFSMAFALYGIVTLGYIENNPLCSSLLEAQHPHAHGAGDFYAKEWRSWDLTRARVVTGGPSCTPYSNAGKRGREHNPVSSQVADMSWVAERFRPDIVCVENVLPLLECAAVLEEADRRYAELGYYRAATPIIDHELEGCEARCRPLSSSANAQATR